MSGQNGGEKNGKVTWRAIAELLRAGIPLMMYTDGPCENCGDETRFHYHPNRFSIAPLSCRPRCDCDNLAMGNYVLTVGEYVDKKHRDKLCRNCGHAASFHYHRITFLILPCNWVRMCNCDNLTVGEYEDKKFSVEKDPIDKFSFVDEDPVDDKYLSADKDPVGKYRRGI